MKLPTLVYTPCHNGRTGLPENHLAEGWLLSPEGKPILAMCRQCAALVIAEYRDKLGEEWTFRAA
jgi:hypothetical protein